MSDELSLCDLGKSCNHLGLLLEIVLVWLDLTPESVGLILKRDVFLSNDCMNSASNSLEVFVFKIFDIFSLLNQEFVNAANQVLSWMLWWLNTEYILNHIFTISIPAVYNVTELLFCSQVSIKWLIKILHYDHVHKLIGKIVFHRTYFVERTVERVLISFILKRDFNLESNLWLKCHTPYVRKILNLDFFKIELILCIFYKLDSFVVFVISTDVPNWSPCL